MENECTTEFTAAKKMPEHQSTSNVFPPSICFAQQRSHFSAVQYDAFYLQGQAVPCSSTMVAPCVIQGQSFATSANQMYINHGSAMIHGFESSLSVSGRRQMDFRNPCFRSRPPARPPQNRSSLPPLPNIAWSDSKDMWNLMCWKDTVYGKDPNYFPRHPSIQPRMRAILFDWISEVCDVYKLHRETYHLTVDFVDRYLSKTDRVPKEKLQLVGVTSLFIAAKLEEIYPPKCSEFATVTDGACDEGEIRDMEVIILKRLNWALSPVTTNNWLTVYLQLLQRECDFHLKPLNGTRRKDSTEFAFPKFNRHSFLQLCRLVDLCLLDGGCVGFQHGVLAASALCSLFEPEQAVLRVSGFSYEDLRTCVDWMRPFAETVKELGEVQPKILPDIQEEDRHNIQTHDFDLNLLERVEFHRKEMLKYRLSPDYSVNGAPLSAIFPTPPQSDERPQIPTAHYHMYTP